MERVSRLSEDDWAAALPEGEISRPEVTFLMPCLNERESAGQVIDGIRAAFDGTGLEYEVLVADNGSEDGSVELCVARGARVVHVAQRGYGAALQGGIAAATADIVVMGDADGSYPFADSAPLIQLVREGADIAIGDRFAGGISMGAMPWKNRYVGNPALSWFGRKVSGLKIRDFHCGLRAFNREAVRSLPLTSPGMEYASEMLVEAARQGLVVREHPVRLLPDLRSRPPHLRPWRDGYRHLHVLLVSSPRMLFFVPAALLLMAAALVLAISAMGVVRLGSVGLSTATSILAASLGLISLTALWAFAIARDSVRVERTTPGPRYGVWLLPSAAIGLVGLAILLFDLAMWAVRGFGAMPDGNRVGVILLGAFLLTAGGLSIVMVWLAESVAHALRRGR